MISANMYSCISLASNEINCYDAYIRCDCFRLTFTSMQLVFFAFHYLMTVSVAIKNREISTL